MIFYYELYKIDNLDYKIIYKLHPSECEDWQKNFPWLEESDIEVVEFSGKEIYQLFAESEIQIGVYSTAIFEGLSFDLKTFLYDAPGIEYMQPLVEGGYATKIGNTEEFLEKMKTKEMRKFNTELLFKSNSLENIRNKIDEIIKSK